jgi:hypothetical protein
MENQSDRAPTERAVGSGLSSHLRAVLRGAPRREAAQLGAPGVFPLVSSSLGLTKDSSHWLGEPEVPRCPARRAKELCTRCPSKEGGEMPQAEVSLFLPRRSLGCHSQSLWLSLQVSAEIVHCVDIPSSPIPLLHSAVLLCKGIGLQQGVWRWVEGLAGPQP